jgi:quinol monooxygenase YgiN
MLLDLASTRASSSTSIATEQTRGPFLIYEVWRDVEALKGHFVTDDMQARP